MTEKKTNILGESRISLAEAMNRTNYWREAIKPLFANNYDQLPRSFYIPFEDIKALADLYPDAAGARAYFTLPSPGFKRGEGVSAVLVPVVIDAEGIYRDMIIPSDSQGQDPSAPDPGEASLYDFTKPCPPCCDPESELF